MKNLVSKTLLSAAGISFLAALPCAAQVAIVPSPLPQQGVPTERKRMQQIKLRFVRPSVMAWWLDSKNYSAPPGLGPYAGAQAAGIRLNFPLPAGVDRIVAIDPQNALLVFGTDEGAQQLREIIAALDKAENLVGFETRQIAVEARLLTIKIENLDGIWAALFAQTGRATPAIAFLKPGEELLLGEQIARREARFERTERLTIASGAAQSLDFGPPANYPNSSAWKRDFSSAMPVIPPPQTGDMNNAMPRTSPLLPAPLGGLRLQIQPTVQSDESVSLDLRELAPRGILGRATSARFDLRAGDTLALALPSSTPGTRAFLLFSAKSTSQFAPLSRIPDLRALPPLMGGLFRAPQTPQAPPTLP